MTEEPITLVGELMARCGVKVPEPEFIKIVSNALHELEAPIYDERHPEITSQVAPQFDEFVAFVLSSVNRRRLRILDIGCGTGFASQSIIERLGGQIAQLVCSDISLHMLEQCRKRIGGQSAVSFVLGDIDSVRSQFPAFDLVVTCSVVHHIPDVPGFLHSVCELVDAGGFYLMMHEPSDRFYRNPFCKEVLDRFSPKTGYRRPGRFTDPRGYHRRLKKWLGMPAPNVQPSLEKQTSQLLLSRGAIQSPLSEREVRQLVDIHVPAIHSGSFTIGYEGFDVDDLKSRCLPGFVIRKFHSYGFLGPYFVGGLSPHWRRLTKQLAAKYPDDGAQFCTLWQKAFE